MGRRWFRSSPPLTTSDRPKTDIPSTSHQPDTNGKDDKARKKKCCGPAKGFKSILSCFRFPKISRPRCFKLRLSFPTICRFRCGRRKQQPRLRSGRITGTLFGYRGGNVSLALQASPIKPPVLVIDLAIPTHALFKELHSGPVLLSLECRDKRQSAKHKKKKKLTIKKKKNKNKNKKKNKHSKIVIPKRPFLLSTVKKRRWGKKKAWFVKESEWDVICNGKGRAAGEKREPTTEDNAVIELLRAVTTGAGVLPGKSISQGPDWEMAYMRSAFDRAVGSGGSSQTMRMVSPGGKGTGSRLGPDLTISFARV